MVMVASKSPQKHDIVLPKQGEPVVLSKKHVEYETHVGESTSPCTVVLTLAMFRGAIQAESTW